MAPIIFLLRASLIAQHVYSRVGNVINIRHTHTRRSQETDGRRETPDYRGSMHACSPACGKKTLHDLGERCVFARDFRAV